MIELAESPSSIHVAFDSASLPSPESGDTSFSYPDPWREYQDCRYGAESRLEREQQLAQVLESSGITKVITVMPEDEYSHTPIAFTLDVQKALQNCSATADAMNELGGAVGGTTPLSHELSTALKKLTAEGVREVICIPSPRVLPLLAKDLHSISSALSLPPDTCIIFSWSGSTVIANAGDSYHELYQNILKNV